MSAVNIEDLPDVGINDNEAVCPLTGYTYNRGLRSCPHHYMEEVDCAND